MSSFESAVGGGNIEMLLRAAMYLDRRETELCDHRYASASLTGFYQQRHQQQLQHQHQRKPKPRTISRSSQSSGGGRSLHNELEKNRRANLRNCLESLRDTIPAHGPTAKNTTLQLLKRAKTHIITLEAENREFEEMKRRLLKQRRQLSEHLKRRASVSSGDNESSSSSPSGSPSPTDVVASFQFLQDSDSASSPATSVTDNDDVDIMGSTSESDDYGR